MNQHEKQELLELIAAHFDGTANTTATARLEALLADDSQAQAFLAENCQMHSLLLWEHGGIPPADLPESPAAPLVVTQGKPPVHSSEQTRRAHGPPTHSWLGTSYWRAHRLQFGMVALALTLLLWVGFIYIVRPASHESRNGELPFGTVASITELRAATWDEAAKTYQLEDTLIAGDTLQLATGFVEVSFRNGAVVLLQGPAAFTVDTRGAGTLEHGRLVAHIEKLTANSSTAPFAIYTPLAEIIDRGTEFGVETRDDGTTAIEVFQGRIEATPTGPASSSQSRSIHLTRGQTASIAPGDAHFSHDQTVEEFVRAMPAGEMQPAQLTAANWRTLGVWGDTPNDGDDTIEIYSVHWPREKLALLSFDLSAFHGDKVYGSGTLTFTIQAGDGVLDDDKFELELYQLNSHNAGVNLAAASPFFVDGGVDSSGTAWRNNTGTSLENLTYNNSLLDITSRLLASRTGPFAGDSATSSPTPGTQVSLTIPQATLQSWLDQMAPPIVVLTAATEQVVDRPGEALTRPRLNPYRFGDGDLQPAPTLSFTIGEPPQTPADAPASSPAEEEAP